jgi:N-methylhydantoinase A
VLAFDMGGTTAKATLIKDGIPLEKTGGEVGGSANLASRFFGGGGYAIRVPGFDIVEVGAGGGSLAWVDDGGALKVGPQSAGVNPGPACYARGGSVPTVTDANVVLGYMNPVSIGAGTVAIDREAAVKALQDRVCEPLKLELLTAAFGIIQVANSTVMRALRAVSVERGIDPREVTLMAFGGSGPMHAVGLADTMGIRKVYVPTLPGVFSAVGLALADYRHDLVRSMVVHVDDLPLEKATNAYREMEDAALKLMEQEGVALDQVHIAREVDLVYRGQDEALTVTSPALDDRFAATLLSIYRMAHRAAYGFERQAPVDIVSFRLRATAPSGNGSISRFDRRDGHAHGKAPTERTAYFGLEYGSIDVPVIGRDDLGDKPRAGPLIVEEPYCSTVVPPMWSVRLDHLNNLEIEKQG